MSLLEGIKGALKLRAYLSGIERLKQNYYIKGLIVAYKLQRVQNG